MGSRAHHRHREEPGARRKRHRRDCRAALEEEPQHLHDEQPNYYAEITDDWIYPWQRIDDSGDLVAMRPVPQLS
ncbi:MAG: hypothetical protein R2856_35390 [Caldilineaceae bacterium]